MASSGSYNFTVTRDDIIKQAYGEIGLYDPESDDGIDAALLTDATTKLNMLVKTWAKKYNLHLLQDVVLFLTEGAQSYSLGDASTDAEWCAWDDYAQTTLSAAAASGATSLSLTSATGFATADRIGVLLDSGAINWSALTLLSGTTATVPAISGAAASGNVVFGYTSRITRPLRVVRDSIFRRDIDDNDIPVELVAKTDYDLLTSKTSEGKIIKVAYQPFLTSGRLWTWQCADSAEDVLRFTVERPMQDFDSTTDNPDLPVEASVALYKALAVLLAPGNGAAAELPVLRAEAAIALEEWQDGDRETASVQFMPDIRR